MGDHAPATVIVWGITDENREAVFQVFADHGFGADWGSEQLDAVRDIVDGAVLTDPTAWLGMLWEVGGQLEELGVSYYGSQEAKYEFDGEVRIYFPDLGRYEGTGSQEGHPVVYAHEIEQMIAETTTREDLVAALEAKTGKPWRDRVNELIEKEAAC